MRIDLLAGFIEAGLCGEHRKPITDFIARLPEHKFIKIPRDNPRARKTTFRIHTMEEVEHLKKKPR